MRSVTPCKILDIPQDYDTIQEKKMSIRTKFNLILGLTTLLGILITGFLVFRFLQNNARAEVIESARIMLQSARSIRSYTVEEVRPLLALQQKRAFLPQTVPAYSARIFHNNLQQEYPEYSYKEATLNPTNPVDRATAWEEDIINVFRNNPERQELIGERETATGMSLYLSQPIEIKNEACLVCHSTPENAPETMLKIYGNANGFGWKLNEVVGAQIVAVPMSLPLQRAEEAFKVFIAALIALFLLVAVLLNLILHFVVIKPLNRIARSANKISTGDLSTPELVVRGKDEIASLSQSFNRMHRSLGSAVKMLDESGV